MLSHNPFFMGLQNFKTKMKTQNKAVLIGYLGADPKIFETKKGHQYATFRMATDQYFKNKNRQEIRITTWHAI